MKNLRKFLLLVLGIILILSIRPLFAEPVEWTNKKSYFPYPVIFIHGINSNATTWQTSISALKQYFTNEYRTKFYDPNGIQYPKPIPNPADWYLEVFEYGDLKGDGKDTSGSFNHLNTYNGKLHQFIVTGYYDKDNVWHDGILKTYYGSNWQSNPQAKVILIAHSQGGLISRYYIQHGGAQYVERLIDMGTAHKGAGISHIAYLLILGPSKRIPIAGWLYKELVIKGLLGLATYFSDYHDLITNVDGGSVEDQNPGSAFLTELNGNTNLEAQDKYVLLIGNVAGKDGDTVVSLDSQKAVGVLNLPSGQIIEMPGIEHTQETLQHEPIFKAVEGIDTLNIPEVKINTNNLNPYLTQPVIWGEYTDYLPAFSGLKVELTGFVDGAQQNTETFTNDNGYLTGSADSIHGLFNQPLLGTSPQSYKLLTGGLADNGKEIKLKAKISKENTGTYPFYISTEDEYAYQYLSFIYGTAPSDQSQEVTLDTPIVIYCQENVRSETVNTSNIRITPSIAGTFLAQGKVIAFTPSAPLQDNTQYTVTIKGDDPATYNVEYPTSTIADKHGWEPESVYLELQKTS